ncbi:hypothetical protein GGI35DRAFT_451290 [Trichoderma velutinum]
MMMAVPFGVWMILSTICRPMVFSIANFGHWIGRKLWVLNSHSFDSTLKRLGNQANLHSASTRPQAIPGVPVSRLVPLLICASTMVRLLPAASVLSCA